MSNLGQAARGGERGGGEGGGVGRAEGRKGRSDVEVGPPYYPKQNLCLL